MACMQIRLHLYDTDVNLWMYFKIICFTASSGVTLSVLFFFFRDRAACVSLCVCVLCVCVCVCVGSDLPAQTKIVNDFRVVFSRKSKILMVN